MDLRKTKSEEMNASQLRTIVEPQIIGGLLAVCTHDTIAQKLAEIGLTEADSGETRRQKIKAALDLVTEADLAKVVERFLSQHPQEPSKRNKIQDLIWVTQRHPEIPKKNRRELSRKLCAPLFRDAQKFLDLLDQLWVLDSPLEKLLGSDPNSLRSRVERHMIRNPDDWSTEDLFNEIGAFEASDRRFGLFIEGLASSEVLVDEDAQRAFVGSTNSVLKGCSLELVESGEMEGGYPVFRLRTTLGGVGKKPKNLIFGSPNKPDIRLTNSIDNDIEIVSNPNSFLVFDEPITDAGLSWSDVQNWWSRTKNISDPEIAKTSLYKRLKEALPESSPPQQKFYHAFHQCFSPDIPSLPALLPEVWMHWDPKTVKERGADALLRFRMDFLMLFPNHGRVVIEVDGLHHYSNSDRQADPAKYAKMVSADRDQRLAGYEIYRFGATELDSAEKCEKTVRQFFERLFQRHGVAYR